MQRGPPFLLLHHHEPAQLGQRSRLRRGNVAGEPRARAARRHAQHQHDTNDGGAGDPHSSRATTTLLLLLLLGRSSSSSSSSSSSEARGDSGFGVFEGVDNGRRHAE